MRRGGVGRDIVVRQDGEPGHNAPSRRQDGSITILALVLACLALLSGLFLFDMAVVFRARSEAQGAADAAAKAAGLELSPLLGVGSDPVGAAASYATANGAEVVAVAVDREGVMMTVTVTVRRAARTLFVPLGRSGFWVTATSRCYLDPYGALRDDPRE